VVFPTGAYATVSPIPDKLIVESQDGVNARVRMVRPFWHYSEVLNFTLHNANLGIHEFNYMDDAPDFLSIEADWKVFCVREVTTADYGTYGPCRVSFYDINGGTMATLFVTFVVADTRTGAIPAPRPWNRNSEALLIDFAPGTWLGPMTNTYADVTNTGNGTMRLNGRASCMTPPHPDYLNDDSGGYGNGLYEFRMRFDKNHIGNNTGPLAILWPYSNIWPGPEIDLGEFMTDGSNAPGPGGVHYFANHYRVYDPADPDTWGEQRADGSWTGVDGNNIWAIQDNTTIAPNRFWDPTQWHIYSALLTNSGVSFYVDGKLLAVDMPAAPDFANGGENHTIGLMCNSDDQGIECSRVRWVPEGLLSNPVYPPGGITP
jgi:hypothetical protein